ncbi:(Fe-S)-binding protein [Algiphilus sp.]|uniref:(Fe-S)-binding protein n=1 Tax=Algiphilus sp. TaxID=1872431 RepID=UPI0032EFBF34
MPEETAGAARADNAPRDAYLFVTCIVDLFAPEAGVDAAHVLNRLGITVHFPKAQTCCGQPAYTTGFPREARAVVTSQLELFQEPWPVVVPSGSCSGMLKWHWPKLFDNDPALRAKAEDVAARTVEFTDYIVNTLGVALPVHETSATRVALHTSCTARREMGTLECGRALLDRLPGVACVPHAQESECCGFGGTFAVKHPEVSASMAADKLAAIAESGCDTYVSADSGCLLNLNLTRQRNGIGPRGVHIASFLRSRIEDGALT